MYEGNTQLAAWRRVHTVERHSHHPQQQPQAKRVCQHAALAICCGRHRYGCGRRQSPIGARRCWCWCRRVLVGWPSMDIRKRHCTISIINVFHCFGLCCMMLCDHNLIPTHVQMSRSIIHACVVQCVINVYPNTITFTSEHITWSDGFPTCDECITPRSSHSLALTRVPFDTHRWIQSRSGWSIW